MTGARMELTVTLAGSLLCLLVVGGVKTVVRGASHTPAWPHPYWNIPGRYCSAHYHTLACCPGPAREDRCHTVGTSPASSSYHLKRSYHRSCHGSSIAGPQCSYKGEVYSVGATVRDNCNSCTCQVRPRAACPRCHVSRRSPGTAAAAW